MTTQMTMIPVHMGTTSRWLRTLRLQAGSLLEQAPHRNRHARRCFPYFHKGFQEILCAPDSRRGPAQSVSDPVPP